MIISLLSLVAVIMGYGFESDLEIEIKEFGILQRGSMADVQAQDEEDDDEDATESWHVPAKSPFNLMQSQKSSTPSSDNLLALKKKVDTAIAKIDAMKITVDGLYSEQVVRARQGATNAELQNVLIQIYGQNERLLSSMEKLNEHFERFFAAKKTNTSDQAK